ncbi:pilus assembly protein TadG-related protein [Bacillus tuaregi]|uniref:pilus assembly protein TadG-related protein n=1 Tax=Bacillus tuaregi TaxID=1816695 RepID=UPI0008F849B5|nr:pilus assembly protein TadG-related protein [Bacillus tuaregi]
MKAFLRNEAGQVMVFVAILMTVFIGFLALVVDFGSLYLEKSRLQKTADAAALASGQELPGNNQRAMEEAIRSIQLNDENPDNFSIILKDQPTAIEVHGSKKVSLYFAKLFGVSEQTITATARVELEAGPPIKSATNTVPLGFPKLNYLKYGSSVIFFGKETVHINYSGKSNTFKEELENGFKGNISVNKVYETYNGNQLGNIKTAIDDRIGDCPHATYRHYPSGCKRVVLVPLYESLPNSDNVRIVGFASFFLKSVSNTSADVEAVFLEELTDPPTFKLTKVE